MKPLVSWTCVTLRVNGAEHTLELDPRVTLLDALLMQRIPKWDRW
jgi:hypothetical protein